MHIMKWIDNLDVENDMACNMQNIYDFKSNILIIIQIPRVPIIKVKDFEGNLKISKHMISVYYVINFRIQPVYLKLT